MTGTGTQTDPYIIMTAADLYSMDEIGGTNIYFKLGTDIDLNGTPYAEHFTGIPMKCAGLDGGGHCIRNIINTSLNTYKYIFFVTPRTGGSMISVKNLRLENVQLTGEFASVFYSGPDSNKGSHIELYNCVFLLNVKRYGSSMPNAAKRSCMIHESISSLKMELCTICFAGEFTYPFAFFGGMTIKRCHLHLDMYIDSGPSSSYPNGAVIASSTVSESYVTGSIRYGDVNRANQLYRHITDSNSTFDNSYFALSVENAKRLFWDGNFITTCFYNSDLIPETEQETASSISDTRRLHALTTAQCKDAEYLASIGFLCVGDEE